MNKQSIYRNCLKTKLRTYFFDLMISTHGAIYLAITQSDWIREKVQFSRKRIVIFDENIEDFAVHLEELLEEFKRVVADYEKNKTPELK